MRTALRAYPAVLGERGRDLCALEQHLPDVLVRRVEELAQSLVLGRVELPQVEISLLTWKDTADKTWTMLTSLSFLLAMFRIHFWSPVSSTEDPQDRPFSFQDVSRVGIPDQNLGAATHLALRGSVM